MKNKKIKNNKLHNFNVLGESSMFKIVGNPT
jgi:hypothetical protein